MYELSNYGRDSVDVATYGKADLIGLKGQVCGHSIGTSFSAPQVAAYVAKLWVLYPNLTPQEVKSFVMDNSIPISQLHPDNQEGYPIKSGGKLNVYYPFFDPFLDVPENFWARDYINYVYVTGLCMATKMTFLVLEKMCPEPKS